MSGDYNKIHKIEDIKRRLYDKGEDDLLHYKEGILHEEKHNVSTDWQKNDMSPKKHKTPYFFKAFFIFALIFFIGASGFALFKYFKGGSVVSSNNIEVNIIGNAFTQGGEELPLQIEIINHNNASLELVNMVVEYPRGATQDESDIVRLPRDSIGTIKSGERVKRNVNINLFGDQNTVRNVVVKLEYHPEASNAIFTKETIYPVTINSSPVALSFLGPDEVGSNQEVNFKISVDLNTTLPSDQAVLKVEYPIGFKYEEADIDPSLGNSIWSLENLSKTNPLELNIKGTLNGQDNDEKVFRVYVGTIKSNNQSSIEVVYNSLLHSILIKRPFLDTSIVINGDSEEYYSTQGGKELKVNIVWSNNLPNRVDDVQIIAKLSGNAFDRNTVVSDGFYDSSENVIIWDRNSYEVLDSVEPGTSGSVNFSFKPLSLIGLAGNIKDPQILIEVSIKGREPSNGIGISDINNFRKKVVKILSDFQISSSAFYVSGEKPLRAEKNTTYKIVWSLSNSANTITQAQARARLPVYVKWEGTSSKEDISFDEVTKEVVWNIGNVKPNTGFGSSEREAYFNVSIKPSISQIGSVPLLSQEIYLSGKDAFSDKIIKSSYKSISTLIQNDPNFNSGDERVLE